MTKRNWYGCYDPKGVMCVSNAFSDDSISDAVNRMSPNDVDDFFAVNLNNTNRFNEDYKDVVQDNSTIILCNDCMHNDNFEACKRYREKKKLRVIR